MDLPKSGQIFSEAWEIYKNRFVTLIGLSLIPAIASVLVGVLAAGGVLALLSFNGVGSGIEIFGGIIALVVFGLLLYITVWSFAAQLVVIRDQTESIGWGEAFHRSRGNVGALLSTSILFALAVMGGFILLIIPGIIFALWFSQSPYIVLDEGLTNSAALSRSKYYVRGRWGQVFGKIFYIGIITALLSSGISVLLGVLSGLLALQPQATSWVSNVFSLVWTPLLVVYSYQLYKHLRATMP